MADLQSRTGVDFDRTYIGRQIRMHRNAKNQDKAMHDMLRLF